MKMILLLTSLLVLSCSASYKETPADKDSIANQQPILQSFSIDSYNTQTEGVFGFLWPKNLGALPTQSISQIIQSSKSLQKLNKIFRTENQRIKISQRELSCSCLLEGLCEESEDPSQIPAENLQLCLNLEDEKLKNDLLLPETFNLKQILERQILAAGGLWMSGEISMDPATSNILFREVKFTSKTGEEIAIPAGQSGREIQFVGTSVGTMIWSGETSTYSWKLDFIIDENIAFAQGDFEIRNNGLSRKGILGFQLLKK